MATFNPQRVPPQSGWLWLREGIALCRRQPLYFLAVAAGWAGIWYLPSPLTWLLLLGLPVPLAAGCLVAHAADTGNSPFEVIRSVPPKLWRNLLIAGAAPWIVVVALITTLAVLTMPVTLWAGGETGTLFAIPAPAADAWPAFRDLFGVTFLWLCTLGFVGWFLVPLMAIAGLPIVQAYRETVRGIALNWFVIAMVFFIACVCLPLLAFLSPLFAPPLLAVLSSVMYVSFRHIWLGRGMNEPARAGQGVDEDAPTQLTPVPVSS